MLSSLTKIAQAHHIKLYFSDDLPPILVPLLIKKAKALSLTTPRLIMVLFVIKSRMNLATYC